MHCPTGKQELLEIFRRSLVELAPREETPLNADAGRAVVGLLVSYSPSDGRGLEFLMTLRSSEVKHHAGQVCLPGGMIDPEDAGAGLKALDREFEEEVGIGRGSIEWVEAPWDELASRYGLRVTPYLGFIARENLDPLAPQASEVAQAEWLPLKNLFDASFWSVRTVIASFPDAQGIHRTLNLALWSGWRHVTWGLTAKFLEIFVRRISGAPPIELEIRNPI